MSDLIIRSAEPLALPSVNVTIRPGVMSDLPFIDSLQKQHTKQVGWMPTKQLEGKIGAGHVLVAWAARPCSLNAEKDMGEAPMPHEEQVGYCIGHDQYFKRDDVGIIYQMNVVPMKQRGLVGATLLKAMFDRAAYGCKLFCCWCAQDIEANYFWESLGFVPLAFRAGSAKASRVHIFWQRRIRAGDSTTPYWFPSQTTSGSIREDRIVLPIPPGTHWRDAKPLILPSEESTKLEALNPKQIQNPKSKIQNKKPVEKPLVVKRNGLMFDIPKQGEPLPEDKLRKETKEKSPRVKPKNDPRLIAAARELRDRWLEEVNGGRYLPATDAKYDVCRMLDDKSIRLSAPARPAPQAA